MRTKRNLDETDLAILQLLAEDARRSFSDLAEAVDLSPPAVSDRVDRLQEQGVIERFTIDVDRSTLQHTTPVLLEFEVVPPHADECYQAVSDLAGVEHVFKTHDEEVVAHGHAPRTDVGEWIREGVDVDHVTRYEVKLLDRYDWTVDVDGAAFSLSCVVCGNAVDRGGVTTEIGGETKSFCCPSCETEYEEWYESHSESAGEPEEDF